MKLYIGNDVHAPVMTTVICTSNTKIQKREELINGDSVYRIEVVMASGTGMPIRSLKTETEKIHKGKRLRRRDIFPCSWTPLMSGDMEMSGVFIRALSFSSVKNCG